MRSRESVAVLVTAVLIWHKIPQVINVIPAADYDYATRQYRGPSVGVQVDKAKNVGKVERAMPSKLVRCGFGVHRFGPPGDDSLGGVPRHGRLSPAHRNHQPIRPD
jgi:hypothetical protein